jgi:F0F1-type ATP synthase delta subunit
VSKISRHRVAQVLADSSLKSGLDEKRFSRSIAAYLLETGRTGELQSLLRDISEARSEHGVVEVVAVSAHPLSAAARAELEQFVKGLRPDADKIIITLQPDPSVLGGVRLELPHRQLDMTVRAKLNKFKQRVSADGAF